MARKKSISSENDNLTSTQDGKNQAVGIAMQQIEHQFGKGSIMKMGESLKKTL